MSKNVEEDISIIITLFKTPIENIQLLNQYRNFKVLIFNQAEKDDSKKKLEDILKFNFEYYSSKKNLGNSRSSNILLSKVKTRYCLFTQPDVTVDDLTIKKLVNLMKLRENVIFAGPIIKNNVGTETKDSKQNYIEKEYLDASCMLCDVKKTREIGFFDENFFLYWNDEDLMARVNKSNYIMIQSLDSFAIHKSSQSSKNDFKVNLIRGVFFKYGEYLYDYKYKKFRLIKLIRQLFQNFLFMLLNFVFFKGKKALKNISFLIGILIFIKFIIFNRKALL
tara:strand:+ start:813 stop:1649 length:837 start_codon:yes stop_codon:yes gene_type:complete